MKIPKGAKQVHISREELNEHWGKYPDQELVTIISPGKGKPNILLPESQPTRERRLRGVSIMPEKPGRCCQ